MENVKLEKMNRLAEKTLLLCERKGVEGITISQVARLANLSRPWIYKYIGQTQEDLLSFALTHFGNSFALLEVRPNPKDSIEWMESVREGFEHITQVCAKNPWVLPLYFRYKGQAGPLGQKIRDIEQKFVTESAKEMQIALGIDKKIAAEHARFLTVIRMGLVHDVISLGTNLEKKAQATQYFCDLCTKTLLS